MTQIKYHGSLCKMDKMYLRSWVMRAEAFVEEASAWAKELVRGESRYPGDYLPAMKRVASKLGLPFTVLWALHYRKPKSLGVEKYAAIAKAYADAQARKRNQERESVQATTPLGKALLRASDYLVREEGEDLGE
jgi:hypothetical protein